MYASSGRWISFKWHHKIVPSGVSLKVCKTVNIILNCTAVIFLFLVLLLVPVYILVLVFVFFFPSSSSSFTIIITMINIIFTVLLYLHYRNIKISLKQLEEIPILSIRISRFQ